MDSFLLLNQTSHFLGAESIFPRTPTHSADMRKDSIVEKSNDMTRKEERKGVIVTIFVATCMAIILTIGVVALILKGKGYLVDFCVT